MYQGKRAWVGKRISLDSRRDNPKQFAMAWVEEYSRQLGNKNRLITSQKSCFIQFNLAQRSRKCTKTLGDFPNCSRILSKEFRRLSSSQGDQLTNFQDENLEFFRNDLKSFTEKLLRSFYELRLHNNLKNWSPPDTGLCNLSSFFPLSSVVIVSLSCMMYLRLL